MRQVLPEGFIRQVGSSTSDATVATFKSAQGTIVSIQVLTHSVVRVCHQIGGGSNAAATTENSSPNCTIVGPLGRTCTLKRDIPSLFPCPIVQVTTTPQEDGKGGSSTTTRIETDRLVVEARLHGGSGDLVLCWFIKPSAATLSSASISSSSASSPSSLSPSLVQVAEDLPFRAYAFDRKCSGVYHYMKKPAPNAQANVSKVEHYYGGERASPLDLSGRRFRMDAVDALGYDPELSDPLYKVTPFHLTVVQDPIQSTVSSYGIYYDHLSSGVMDFGCEIDAFYGPYKYFYASETNMLDYYFIAGDTAILNTATPVDATTTPTTTPDHQSLLGSVLQGYMDIIGRPALPPKYAFGYLASAMGYAESENAQAILETFPDMCNKNDIPCDLIHLSSGYTVDPVTGARNVFLWNK